MEDKTIHLTPAGKKEVELTLGRFRLTNSMRFSLDSPSACEYIPAIQQLSLECCGAKNSYVIAFIEYDEHNEVCDMRTVGTRFINDIKTDKDWHDVHTLLNIANEYILALNEEQEEDE